MNNEEIIKSVNRIYRHIDYSAIDEAINLAREVERQKIIEIINNLSETRDNSNSLCSIDYKGFRTNSVKYLKEKLIEELTNQSQVKE